MTTIPATTGNAAGIAAGAEWNQAIAWEQQIKDWCKANPPAEGEPAWAHSPTNDWLKANGIPDILSAGRFNTQVRRDGTAWRSLKLARPTKWGTHVIQCRSCDHLSIVNHPLTNNGLCHDCRGTHLETRKVEQAAKRIERRQERSEELRNRKGRCLVCSAEMTVARVTKTTCSDRCRKQWIRKGAEAFPLPETPTHVQLGDGQITVAEAALRLNDRLLNHQFSLICAGQKTEADELLPKLKAEAKRFSRLAELVKLRAEAPAIFLWELSQ